MDPKRPDRILDDWSAVAHEARRPAAPPRRVAMRSGLSGATLAGATVLVAAVVIAGVWFGRPGTGPIGGVGSSPSAGVDPSVVPVATPSAPAVASPSAPGVASTPPSAVPTTGTCVATKLAARITSWEGAAGHRIANVELTNIGTDPCTTRAMARPQLVDGRGAVLIDGTNPPASALLTLAPGAVLKTLVQDGNYCGAAPMAPVSVAFVLADGGRIIATPVSPSDVTLPPCNGAPGSAGDIEMHPWAP
jgi:Protein of unknown function (DUF4232)